MLENDNITAHGLGETPPPYDNRNWIYEDLIGIPGPNRRLQYGKIREYDTILDTATDYPTRINDGIPSSVDNSVHLDDPRDQGIEDTCACFAMGAIKEVHEKIEIGFKGYISTRFLWNLQWQVEGRHFLNGYIVGDYLTAYGAVPEYQYPYATPENITVPQDLVESADPLRISAYSEVTSILGVKNALNDPNTQGAVYISVPVFYNSNPRIWHPSGAQNGNHGMAIVGYDDNAQVTYNGVTYTGCLKIRNSWGANWNGNGYVLFPYSDWGKHNYVVTYLDKVTTNYNPPPFISKYVINDTTSSVTLTEDEMYTVKFKGLDAYQGTKTYQLVLDGLIIDSGSWEYGEEITTTHAAPLYSRVESNTHTLTLNLTDGTNTDSIDRTFMVEESLENPTIDMFMIGGNTQSSIDLVEGVTTPIEFSAIDVNVGDNSYNIYENGVLVFSGTWESQISIQHNYMVPPFNELENNQVIIRVEVIDGSRSAFEEKTINIQNSSAGDEGPITFNLTNNLTTNRGLVKLNGDLSKFDSYDFGKKFAEAFGVDFSALDNNDVLDSGDTQLEATQRIFMNVTDAIVEEIIKQMKLTGSVTVNHDNSGSRTYTLDSIQIHYGES